MVTSMKVWLPCHAVPQDLLRQLVSFEREQSFHASAHWNYSFEVRFDQYEGSQCRSESVDEPIERFSNR